ncbi:Conidiation protein 6-domain-containing protein [Coniochaeta sp. 2T2.1]|nr:Conidiation protein 6-domain-containing protein [Coniochaeta sp. 2T2.1]
MSDPSDVTNVMRGHKAAISNPNVSEEAKEHSRQVLAAMEGKDTTGSGGSGGGGDKKQQQQSSGGGGGGETTVDGKDAGNVARGLKASISNPGVSDEAKERAKEKLAEMGQ